MEDLHGHIARVEREGQQQGQSVIVSTSLCIVFSWLAAFWKPSRSLYIYWRYM